MNWEIRQGDALERLKEMPDESAHCCVTSPPYWGLRDYGVDGQLGLERTPELYIERMVAVFREVKRVLRSDGTLWVNMGDSYAQGSKGNSGAIRPGDKQGTNAGSLDTRRGAGLGPNRNGGTNGFCKPKDLVGIPWLLAFALRADGWWLRSDIIWAKANCMPESVQDRPTRSHEYLFLLAKSARYFYDADAVKEPCIWDVDGTGTAVRKARQLKGAKSAPTEIRAAIRPAGFKDPEKFSGKNGDKRAGHSRRHDGFNDRWDAAEDAGEVGGFRNKRDVWTVAPAQFLEAHFATFPPKLIEPCILAGCPEHGTVLDPFSGAGTSGLIATRLGRNYIGIELNESYCEMSRRRIVNDAPLLNQPCNSENEGTGTLLEPNLAVQSRLNETERG